MNKFCLIFVGILAGFVDAEERGLVEMYFGNWGTFGALLVFTLAVLVVLLVACMRDLKHWKRSINVAEQMKFTAAVMSDFRMDEMEEEVLKTPNGAFSTLAETQPSRKTDESLTTTQIEKMTAEEKQKRIIQAMYISSNREPPQVVLSRRTGKNNGENACPPNTLETIDEEKELGKKEQ